MHFPHHRQLGPSCINLSRGIFFAGLGLNGVVIDAQLGAYFVCRCFSAGAALRFGPTHTVTVDVCDGYEC